MHHQIIAPVIALVLWSFVMWAWMYATRIPAILRNKLVYDPQRPNADFLNQIPASARWKADNLNNLMEQPTLFYAVVLSLAILGVETGTDVLLAWTYVAIRIVHSLVQALLNNIALRFPVFVLGSLVLLALTLRAAWIVFGF